MKNPFKTVAMQLVRQAAAAHNTDVKTVMRLFRWARDNRGTAPHNFGQALHLSTVRPLDVQACLEGAAPMPPWASGGTQLALDRCKFLYNVIDNFYERKVIEYGALTFYPRIEDLFAPKEAPRSTVEAPPRPLNEPFKAILMEAMKTPETSDSEVVAEADEDEGENDGATPTLQAIGFVSAPNAWEWNKQQSAAFAAVHKWLRTPKRDRPQIFRLFGWAGTGKTEMSKHIADFVLNEAGKKNVPLGDVLFAAYTGKACSVLRVKGCRGADTLHSFLYRPVIDPLTGQCTSFTINHESPLSTAALLIVDEVSMVNEEMAQDLLSFGLPILVLGDPDQLQPVQGEGYFINAAADYMLTDIRRQAADNPIIYLATRAREGKSIRAGSYGDSRVYGMGRHVSDDMYVEHDQILCGMNNTRKTINRRSRRINGKAEQSPFYPVAGDRLMCLRNNKNSGLYNGTMWTSSKPKMKKIMQPVAKGSSEMREGHAMVLAFKVRSLDEVDAQGLPLIARTQCPPHLFNDGLSEPPWRDIAGADHFDYGYGSTVHKAQGSQYDSVLMFDESSTFREHANKHRYTGITRAATRITILL